MESTMNGHGRGASDVEARVLNVFREVLALEDRPLGLDSDIREELAADSLDQLSLFMALEDEFGGSIPEAEADALRTVGDVVAYIERRLAEASGG